MSGSSSRVPLRRDTNLVPSDRARFNRLADSDQMHHGYAAELLLQMRRIATNEVLQSTPPSIHTMNDTSFHLISPIHRPKENSIKILPVGSTRVAFPECATVPSDSSSESMRVSTLTSPHTAGSLRSCFHPSSSRFRTVSIGGVNDVDFRRDWVRDLPGSSNVGSMSPLHLGSSHCTLRTSTSDNGGGCVMTVVTPEANKKLVIDNERYVSTKRHRLFLDSFDQNEEEEEEDDEMDDGIRDKTPSRKPKSDRDGDTTRTSDRDGEATSNGMTTSNKKKILILNPSAPFTHKYVGETVAPDVVVRDVLRKKFSWKSFPELETYLINHRKQYLECSNAMNYTKAQKNYNNELTQGLLQLAANEGYVFEEFTFAAVRDRIRCFYKSFVQATKKKKRAHRHHYHHHNKHLPH